MSVLDDRAQTLVYLAARIEALEGPGADRYDDATRLLTEAVCDLADLADLAESVANGAEEDPADEEGSARSEEATSGAVD